MDEEELVSIDKETRKFITNVDSLFEALDFSVLTLSIVNKHHEESLEEIKGKILGLSDDKITSSVIRRQYNSLNKLHSKIERNYQAAKLVPRGFIISLISQFDAFLGRLIRTLSVLKPGSLKIYEKILTFSQLEDFSSLEDAREFLIEKEIDALLRIGHAEQFEWLESNYDVKLREGLNQMWPRFIEATERRNLFVHTNGFVSNQYIKVCKKHKVKLDEEVQIGTELIVTRDYFETAYDCIFYIGVGLAQVLWRKLLPDEREAADSSLIAISYNLLVESKFDLACALLDFAVEDIKRFASESNRLLVIMNRAQAYKWANQPEKANKIIKSYDWSAASARFRLAEAVLLDDFDKANDIFRKIGVNGEVQQSEFREWPLFRKYRETEDFQKVFEEVFNEPFHSLDELDVANLTTTINEELPLNEVPNHKSSQEDVLLQTEIE